MRNQIDHENSYQRGQPNLTPEEFVQELRMIISDRTAGFRLQDAVWGMTPAALLDLLDYLFVESHHFAHDDNDPTIVEAQRRYFSSILSQKTSDGFFQGFIDEAD